MRRVLVQTNAHKTPPGQRIRHPPRTPVPGRIELRASALDKLVEDLRLQQPVQLLVKRMPRRRGQLRVCDPQILLLLPLLPRPHRHAPILQTIPLHSSESSAYESGLAPRAAKACCEWREPSTQTRARARLQLHTCRIVRSVRDDSVSPANLQNRGKTLGWHPGSQIVSL